jgi:hypothetical protein
MTASPEPTIVVSGMEDWQSKAAFVIQFRPGTDIGAGQLEGKVEHIASYEAARFHSLDELLAFIARVLSQIPRSGQ